MSKFTKTIEAAKLAGAMALAGSINTGCASECELNPDGPILEDPVAFCKANRNATITCLNVEDKYDSDKVYCSSTGVRCTAPRLGEVVNDSDIEYCVEGPADLVANY